MNFAHRHRICIRVLHTITQAESRNFQIHEKLISPKVRPMIMIIQAFLWVILCVSLLHQFLYKTGTILTAIIFVFQFNLWFALACFLRTHDCERYVLIDYEIQISASAGNRVLNRTCETSIYSRMIVIPTFDFDCNYSRYNLAVLPPQWVPVSEPALAIASILIL